MYLFRGGTRVLPDQRASDKWEVVFQPDDTRVQTAVVAFRYVDGYVQGFAVWRDGSGTHVIRALEKQTMWRPEQRDTVVDTAAGVQIEDQALEDLLSLRQHMDDPPAQPVGMDLPKYYVYVRLSGEEVRFIIEPDYSHPPLPWRGRWRDLTYYLWQDRGISSASESGTAK